MADGRSDSHAEAQVLIVDDNREAGRRLAETLGEQGHESVVATSWTEALRAFDPAQTDLVLMDAVMPTVDGFKLTRILRARAGSYVPIVFVTGLDDPSARQRGVDAGADDFLTKPVDPVELRVRLTAMLRIRRLTMDLEARSAELARLANYDALTGVLNRRSLDYAVEVELERSRRYDRPLSLLMLDIDHFKRINDDHGHGVGDAVLQFLGDLLTKVSRTSDLVYRYGGEEFAILTPETSTSAACLLAERIRSAFADYSGDATAAGAQTLSVGVAGTDLWKHRVLPSTMFYAADVALYRAKDAGRDCVRTYEPARETEDLLDEIEDLGR